MQPRTKPVKTHLKKTIFSCNPEKKTETLTLLCVRIINVSTSVWRMELSVGRFL